MMNPPEALGAASGTAAGPEAGTGVGPHAGLLAARARLAGQRILVTGATGLLGQAVIEALGPLDPPPGWLARAPKPPPGWGIPVPADLEDLAAVEAGVRSYRPRFILHLAAAVGDRLTDAVARRVNMAAPLSLQRLATELSARLVVASTVLVLGLDDLVDADEATPRTLDGMIPYVRTKVQMEESLEEGARNGLVPATILRFPRVYGAGDQMIVPAMIRIMREGRMVLIDGGRALQSFVHVDDAAAACVLAMAAEGTGAGATSGAGPAAGGIYHITGGDRVTNREILDLIADAAGLRRVTKSVPRWLALGLASAYELLPLPPSERLSRFRIKYLGCHHHYSIEKARRELGYAPAVRLAEALPGVARQIAVRTAQPPPKPRAAPRGPAASPFAAPMAVGDELEALVGTVETYGVWLRARGMRGFMGKSDMVKAGLDPVRLVVGGQIPVRVIGFNEATGDFVAAPR